MYYNVGLACADAVPFIALPIVIMFIAIGGLFAVSLLLFKIFLWWRIFSKTGYSGAFSLLIFAPFGTLIMLCVLAFSQWPISKQPKQ